MRTDELSQMIIDLCFRLQAHMPEETFGKAGVFDQTSLRYQMTCLAASGILGGPHKAFAHPDKLGEMLVKFIMPWEQHGTGTNMLAPFEDHRGTIYVLTGIRAPGLARAGKRSVVGGGFLEPEPNQPRPQQPIEGVLSEWHGETSGLIPLTEDDMELIDGVTSREGYGGTFPRRLTATFMFSPNRLLPATAAQPLLDGHANKEFSSFALLTYNEMMAADDWAFPRERDVYAMGTFARAVVLRGR